MNGRVLGSVLAILGAIVILVSMFLPWYTTTYTASESFESVSASISSHVNFLPGSSYTITSSCSGTSTVCALASAETGTYSYSGHNQSNTGNLYAAVQYLLIGGGILALLGAILGFMATGGRSRWLTPALLLIVLGLVLGLAAGAYVAADNASAVKSDYGNVASNTTGPWSSFIGSCSGASTCFTGASGPNESASWGPAAGFYIVWVGVVFLLIALVLVWRGRSSAATPMAAPPTPAAPMDAPTDPAMAPPPSGGPGTGS